MSQSLSTWNWSNRAAQSSEQQGVRGAGLDQANRGDHPRRVGLQAGDKMYGEFVAPPALLRRPHALTNPPIPPSNPSALRALRTLRLGVKPHVLSRVSSPRSTPESIPLHTFHLTILEMRDSLSLLLSCGHKVVGERGTPQFEKQSRIAPACGETREATKNGK